MNTVRLLPLSEGNVAGERWQSDSVTVGVLLANG